MRKLILILIIAYSAPIFSQEFEWVEGNTYTNTGERVVAKLVRNSGNYKGVEIIGQVIDSNGNWGYNLPTVANFRMYAKFSGGIAYDLVQDVKTAKITLGIRKVSDTEIHLIANCPYQHMGMRVLFKIVQGTINVAMGDPKKVISNPQGSLVMEKPRYTGDIEHLRISSSGNVGIGKSASNYKLDVAGTIRAEEILVEDIAATNMNLSGDIAANNITVKANGNTADFVFEEDYDLKDLSEVESFIKTNKHLPDIPSATEMEEQGVNLAEMNKLLLQKVEELTLYAIKKDKEVESQKAIVESLERELNETKQTMEERLTKIEALLKAETNN